MHAPSEKVKTIINWDKHFVLKSIIVTMDTLRGWSDWIFSAFALVWRLFQQLGLFRVLLILCCFFLCCFCWFCWLVPAILCLFLVLRHLVGWWCWGFIGYCLNFSWVFFVVWRNSLVLLEKKMYWATTCIKETKLNWNLQPLFCNDQLPIILFYERFLWK